MTEEKTKNRDFQESVRQTLERSGMDPLPHAVENSVTEILWLILKRLEDQKTDRLAISISGCSGCGKTTTASAVRSCLNEWGIETDVVSGDDYPVRYPALNDMERVARYRNGGLQALTDAGCYDEQIGEKLTQLWREENDAAETASSEPDAAWRTIYREGGRKALRAYLGTPEEQRFDLLNRVIDGFRNSSDRVALRRLGREADAQQYAWKDYSHARVLVIEWTHGASGWLKGLDVRVMFTATPEETLQLRKKRNRDPGVTSPFTAQVLRIEQMALTERFKYADLLLNLQGEPLNLTKEGSDHE